MPKPPLFEGFRPNKHTHTQPVELLSTNDQLVAEAASYITHTEKERRIPMTSAGFEAAVPAIERPQTYALDRVATGNGGVKVYWGLS